MADFDLRRQGIDPAGYDRPAERVARARAGEERFTPHELLKEPAVLSTHQAHIAVEHWAAALDEASGPVAG
ncbi:hypothetical protein [Nonomuraea pusilla]|uniref:hypothetical protein n=1 Tax=Nonomuraea pusilla TaxID=46177 RepID=UPI0006E307BD|nr:hypothetical protein [Nonomuraea pusilla]